MNIPTDKIRTLPCPGCHLCGSKGQPLYHNLEDRLFGVPGKWNLVKCPNHECGLIWADPMPIPEDLGRLYESYYTHQDLVKSDSLPRRLYQRGIDQYLSQRYGYSTARNGMLDKLLGGLLYFHPGRRADVDAQAMHLPANPSGRLLEIGFGTGETLKRLQDLGWDVEGIDFDPAAVANGLAKGLKVYLGDLSSQSFPENTFDAVVSSHVIEHVHDPLALLCECHRVLKPGGRLVVLTPNTNSLGHRVFKTDWRGLEPPRHIHLFQPSALVKLVGKADFHNAYCSSTFRGGSILLASLALSNKKNVHNVPPKNQRVWIELVHFFEWMVCKFDKSAGEELLLTATKQSKSPSQGTGNIPAVI